MWKLPLCLLVLCTFGSGFQTYFILMKQTFIKSNWDLVLVFPHLLLESDDLFKWLSLNPLEIVILKYHLHVFYGMITCRHTWVNHIFYCCIAHNCAICNLDLRPKTHSTVGQQITVSHTRCQFLFYFFSLHDPVTPYPIELDKLIYNWHEVNDIYISSKLKVSSGHHEVLWWRCPAYIDTNYARDHRCFCN